jgi:hypothetical protein
MTRRLFSAAVAACAFAASAQADDLILDFDDLAGTGAVGLYHGVDFGSDWRLAQSGSGTPYSGPNYIRPNGNPSFVSEFDMHVATPTQFLGAYVGGWTGSSFRINLYSGGDLVWQSAWQYFAADYTPVFYGVAYTGAVDTVGFYGRPGYWALDNVAFAGPGAVPEPASWALMLGGFGLVGAALRRRTIAFA